MARPRATRRAMLGGLAGVGAASLAGCQLLQRGSDTTTATLSTERARALATEFAPSLYFDTAEQWFPTDPRPYATERDGETVVDGFDALDGYHERTDGERVPDPTVFYNAVGYADSPLAVVQFWFYSVFDQFVTNFHWHDWEVLHVFVDTSGDDVTAAAAQLYVASSHSRKVPNNEFLDPDRTPRILAELGSHSSALSLNHLADQFQRLAEGGALADITNSTIDTLEDVAAIPFAYGLPRDEGSRLPYVVPEYEGAPVYEHDRLPSVDRADLVPDELTVRSFDDLTSPPADLPTRETGLVFDHAGRDSDADIAYDLVPTGEVEHISAFTGPQLSFEFAVPQFAEDAVASHISTAGIPWEQERYTNPAADITEPAHRAALADRYDAIGEAAPVNTVVASISEAVSTDDAPDGEGLTTRQSSVEAVALLESDPEAVPTFAGVAAVRDVPAGDHRLTVNRAGAAPHSESVSVGETGVTAAGVDGEIPLVASADARKLEVDADAADTDLTALAVEDDFAGRLYDAPLDGRDAVYVHRGGAYTTEVRDAEDGIGAVRVNPDPDAERAIRIASPTTGKASLASFVADIAAETREQVAATVGDGDGAGDAVRGLTRALDAVAAAARRAAARAEAGERGNADQQLAAVADRLQRVTERLAEARDALSDPLSAAAENRLEQAQTRTEQARGQERL